jgi:general secretion pathway protein G
MKKGTKGFTFIELLVVIAIIAILSTVVMAGLNSARAKGRDARRLSDIKQMQAALELYFDSCSGYPTVSTTLSTGDNTGCTAGNTKFGSFMNPIPTNPGPGGAAYSYTSDRSTYSMGFSLEGSSGTLGSGAHTATPSGIQ